MLLFSNSSVATDSFVGNPFFGCLDNLFLMIDSTLESILFWSTDMKTDKIILLMRMEFTFIRPRCGLFWRPTFQVQCMHHIRDDEWLEVLEYWTLTGEWSHPLKGIGDDLDEPMVTIAGQIYAFDYRLSVHLLDFGSHPIRIDHLPIPLGRGGMRLAINPCPGERCSIEAQQLVQSVAMERF